MRDILSCAAVLFLFNGCVTVPEGSQAFPLHIATRLMQGSIGCGASWSQRFRLSQ
jgi:hypothetical protein